MENQQIFTFVKGFCRTILYLYKLLGSLIYKDTTYL